MRILWICGARVVGGAENTTLQLVRLLRERGHTVESLCAREGALRRELDAAGIATHRAPVGGSLDPRAWRAVAGALRRLDPDVALVTTANEWVWSCLAPARRARLVLVRLMMLPLPRRVQWLAGRRADAVVAISDAVRRSLALVPAECLHVIRVPAHLPPRPHPPTGEDRAEARRTLGLTGDAHWVAFCGGLRPSKGIGDVLAAVARANERFGETRLFVTGAEPDADGSRRLAAEAARLGLRGRLRYLGRVPSVEPVLTAADVLVVATHSDLGEAIPLVALEAMAVGTPVLAYDVGGVREAIGDDGECGRLARADDTADLSERLVEMLRDADTRRRMAERGLERIRRDFDPERTADRYERLFESLCATERRKLEART